MKSFVKGSVALALGLVFAASSFAAEDWQARNEKAIKDQNLPAKVRTDMKDTGITPSLEPGKIINKSQLPDVELAPGVKSKMYWGKGAMVSWVVMDPNSQIPQEKLSSERIMVIWKGTVEQLVDGKWVSVRSYTNATPWAGIPQKEYIYLPKGSVNAVRAGADGAEFVELYWPVRTDYMAKAGAKVPSKVNNASYPYKPNAAPKKVHNFFDVQFTDLSQATSNSRLLSGEGVQGSFLSIDPNRVSPYHNHPEEQLMIVLRGSVKETVMDETTVMNVGDICYLPENMVHRGEYDKTGCDILDVFWPPRPDFIEKMNARYAAYNAIIPANAEIKLVHDGEKDEPKLNWTEGPCWMDGNLYMSNMWFAPDFSAGSPEKSNMVKMGSDGKLKILVENRQTNGIMTLGNGNLAVCDMFGHKIVEMTPEGKFIRTIVESYNGAPLDGPNDLAIDSKGGIYFTDPQFTPGLAKTQPGKAVFYLPAGKTEPVRIINPGEMGNPNGVAISPDGKTLFLNNTRNLPVGNHIMAYDIGSDGMISNGREFCKLFIPPAVLDKADVMTGADGMKLDTDGNLYCSTVMGVQIFNNKGEFVGIINIPYRNISLAFGGQDMKTLYFACASKLYSIKTNKTGLTNPIK